MSYTLDLWKGITKKINSTYQPSSSPDYSISVHLKEDTSIETPTFLLDLDDWEVNYARFQGHYYFIDDIRRNITGQMEIECTQDVLATYKTEIGNYTAFVERSAHTYDPLLVDPAISTDSKIGYASHSTIDLMYSLENPNGFLNKTGCYLLRVANMLSGNNSATGISTYVLDDSDLQIVFDFMFNENNFTDVLTDMAVKSFFNPFQYILDLRWIPLAKTFFSIEEGAAVSAPVKFGWWTVKDNGSVFNARLLQARVIQKNHRLGCPATLYGNGDFRRYNSQYSQYKCYLFGVGTVDVSPVDVLPNNESPAWDGVRIIQVIDFTTGDMTTSLRRSDGTHIIGEYTSQFAIPVQISQVNSNLFNSSMDVLKTVGNSMQAVGISAAGGAAGVASAMIGSAFKIGESVLSAIHSEVAAGIQGNGMNGSRASLLNMPYYILYYTGYNSCDIPNVVGGRALYRNVQINTLGGFTKCAGASVPIAGFAGDKDAVNAALNGGFYYE